MAIQLVIMPTQKFKLKNVLILGAYRSTKVTDIYILMSVFQSLKSDSLSRKTEGNSFVLFNS